jgi:hypothetical protein
VAPSRRCAHGAALEEQGKLVLFAGFGKPLLECGFVDDHSACTAKHQVLGEQRLEQFGIPAFLHSSHTTGEITGRRESYA